jgi:hypothetical protein
MSRSARKTPVGGVVPVASETADKRRTSKILRRLEKNSLLSGDDSRPIPVRREVSDPWHMAKEGKIRFDPKSDPKRMRK